MGRIIEIPFKPHKFQAEIIKKLKRFSVLVCHRRFGKTVLSINLLVRDALRTKKQNWRGAYLAPLYRQAKAVAWDYLKYYSHPVIGKKLYENELRVDFPNGARITLMGADNPDSLRGIYLDGVVLDEVAQMRPNLWGEVVQPTLADRKGWATFIGTPKGHNQFYDLWNHAIETDAWCPIMYKASDTVCEPPERGMPDREEFERLKSEMTEDEYAQEMECSFSAAIKGAYYGGLIQDAENDGRITNVPHDPLLPVHTAWDLGIDDDMAIWFAQLSPGGEIRLIDYYANSGLGLDHYISHLKEKKYLYEKHLGPHDIKVRELGTGRSRLETAQSLGLTFDVVRDIGVADGINAVRTILPRCWFDKTKCHDGIEALRQYRREYNDKLSTFRNRALHDWCSDPADAFRMLAVGLKTLSPETKIQIGRPSSYRPDGLAWMGA